MAKGTNQKGKILYLEKILKESNETHPCTMLEIIGKLQEYGVSAERKSIYDDMEVLRNYGMDIRFKRGKATGYYVAGQAAAAEVSTETVGKAEKAEQAEAVECNKKTFSWLLPFSESEADKPVKLLCSARKKKEIQEALGNHAQYKEKEDDSLVAAVQVEENPEFYGWLVSMGRDVVIMKPKKAAQAYRDYLKGILKEYK